MSGVKWPLIVYYGVIAALLALMGTSPVIAGEAPG